MNFYHITYVPLWQQCWDCNNRVSVSAYDTKCIADLRDTNCVHVCKLYTYLSLHAQNLKLSWISNCQLHRSVSTIPCFYLTAHCILGVVVCLNGSDRDAACGLHQWDWCSSPNWTSFISMAEPFLSSIGPPGPLNCWRPPTSSLLWAPACGKKMWDVFHLHIDQPGQKKQDLSTSLNT